MRSFTTFMVCFCFCFCCCVCIHLPVCTSLCGARFCCCTCTHLLVCTSLCGACCVRQCVPKTVQKTKAKPPPPLELRGKGIMAKKEPEDRKHPDRATDRGNRKQLKRTDIDVAVPKLSKVRTK